MPDEVSVGEVYRLLQSMGKQIEVLTQRFDSFAKDYVRSDLHEMAVGSTRLDITRLDSTLRELERDHDALSTKHNQDVEALRELHNKDLQALKEAADARFRQMVTAIIGSFVAPIAVGLVLLLLQNKP